MAHERENSRDKAGLSQRRRGGLSADDRRVWQQVARTVRPLKGGFAAALKEAEAEEAPTPPKKKTDNAAPKAAPKAVPQADNAVKSGAGKNSAPAADSAAGRGGGFDSSSYRKLARGRLPLQGRLDLHNYTQQQAHDALLYFVRSAQSQGKRHVLVITGKGLSSGSVGVLRGRVPHWLMMPLFRPYVSAVEPASRAHGGEGAFYVRLRRLL